MTENIFIGLKNRILQIIAQFVPGANSIRPFLHKIRGVHFSGDSVWIGYDVILETSRPNLISIGNKVEINVGCIFVGHYKEKTQNIQVGQKKFSIVIEDNVFIGAGCLILPNVKIGNGSVIVAGSVVSKSIPSKTMASGNPAKPIASCKVSLTQRVSLKEFYKNLRPLR